MNDILVLGYGEIGKAIYKICSDSGLNTYYKDLNKSKLPKTDIDILHVCIPYTDYNIFSDAILETCNKFKPELIIINSTVEIGTTDKLNKLNFNYLPKPEIVYSPCRGVHPNLVNGLKTFVKYVAGNQIAVELAASHFDDIKIETKFMDLRSLEAAKLTSTLYYGWNILFCKIINWFCKNKKLNFSEVYTEWNKTYNKGQKDLNSEHNIRPILYPPDGGISGHCVCENWVLLKKDEPLLCYLSKMLNNIVFKKEKMII